MSTRISNYENAPLIGFGQAQSRQDSDVNSSDDAEVIEIRKKTHNNYIHF